MFLKLLILFQSIYYALSDVTLYKYKSNQHMKFNNLMLRETINSQYFAYPGYHKFDYPLNYENIYFNSYKHFYGTTLLKDYYINKPTNVGNINYYYDRDHFFHYVINIVLSKKGEFTLLHNNKPIDIKYSKTISIYNNIKLKKGRHSFEIYIDGNKVCSCPSYKDGYQQTRYFFGWIVPFEKKNNTIQIKNYSNKIINTSINDILKTIYTINIKDWY